MLRLRIGATVKIFNATDGEFEATIETLDKKQATLKLTTQLRAPAPELEKDILVLFAPVKKDATDFIIEKGTELGARAFQPVMTQFTNTQRVNVERLSAHAVQAGCQSERLSVPEVRPPLKLHAALQDWPKAKPLIVGDERRTAKPLQEVLTHIDTGTIACLTGPEGGFSEEEITWLRTQPFVKPVSLGPTLLKADTAVAALLTGIQMVWGSWQT